MTVADVPFVSTLEPLCFPAPWSAETYRNELLHNRYSAYWVLRPVGGAGDLPPILAYGGYWLMGDEAHVVTIATHPDHRRHGFGRQTPHANGRTCAYGRGHLGDARSRASATLPRKICISNVALYSSDNAVAITTTTAKTLC